MFPLSMDELAPYSLTFGEERDCKNPFTIDIPFMISAMSFGSLGENAVRVANKDVHDPPAGVAIPQRRRGDFLTSPFEHHLSQTDDLFRIRSCKTRSS